jgi:branched-chain amino acid aminotransferase
MAEFVYVNGELVPRDEAKVSVFDHGLLYGDGVFEGIRAYSGRVFRLRQHLERLYASAEGIHLAIPMTIEEMGDALLRTLRANDLVEDAYIRLVVTRGVGDLGLDPRKCSDPTVFIITGKIQLYDPSVYVNGLKVITCETRRTPDTSLNPAIKSLNYLNNILAKEEVIEAGADEGIMLNHEGWVAECTGDNIFVVQNGEIVTPPPEAGILRGITRDAVIEVARARGYTVGEELFRREEVLSADECFLTGTAAEIVPVTSVDGQLIAQGQAGPVTQDLGEAFRDLVAKEGTPIEAGVK